MNRLKGFGVLLSFTALLPTFAHTEEAPAPLELSSVLEASATHFPLILKSLAAQRTAAGRALEVEGSFDLVFDADGFSRLGGFYDGTVVGGTAKQRIRNLGADIYAGYSISDGIFPIYEDVNYTNTGGAAKVGVMFALLRDREFDRQRFDVADAQLDVREADLDLLLTRVGVQQRTQIAYWRWVMAGRKLGVYENLLRIARERQEGLERQVRQGARASIFLTENQQNITRRQQLVTSARRNLAVAANELAIYYRDEAGTPVSPLPEQLPSGDPIEQIGRLADVDQFAVSTALDRRPELALLRNAIRREQNRIALAKNNLKPRLDLGMEVKQPFGAVGDGGISRDTTDTIVGFTFSVPLQRRAERGRLQRSEAMLDEKLEEQRLAEEQIQIELQNVLVELKTSRELLLLASQEVEQSDIMRDAEVRRFESGASDFFLVNIREEVAADARIKLLQAELTTRVARANFDAATVDLPRLGLGGLEP